MDMSHYNKDYDTSHPFHVVAPYEPMGDQPEAIASLADGIRSGQWAQVLVGATGTGKTFTMAKLIEAVQKPTLVIAHNKTLAAQLCSEFKSFFPDNEVGYFVSYYDFYQPEAYIASTDTYIEKDASINDEIDKLRHSATMSLFERRDVIIVASVSCIYGLGDPEDYSELVVSLRLGQEKPQEEILHKLVDIQYSRNDMNLERGTFRVHGDTIEVFPAAFDNSIIRIEMFGDEIDRLTEVDVLTGEVIAERKHVAIYPASHYVTTKDKMERALGTIRQKWATAQASKTIRATWPAASPVRRRIRSSTISPMTSSSSSTNRMSPCRSCGLCTPATDRARKTSSNTASACRRPWTTGR